ncbi:MAG: CopG family transcriptional regulator [Methanobacteriota archaeon]|nr:MAG: CopG family transcriptional regulator [Euryarchaeota archaeon]
MMLISVQIPVHMLRQLEQLVLQGKYPNRSEAIRYAIRDFIRREIKEE